MAGLRTGELEEAVAALSRRPAPAPGAMLALQLGDRAGAVELLRRALEQAARPVVKCYWFDLYAMSAEVALALWLDRRGRGEGDAGPWRAMAAQAVGHLGRYARVFPIGRPRALLHQGLVAWTDGRAGRARRDWRAALAAAERLGMRYEQALALDILGRHGEPGQRPAARERARALFERLGVQDLTSPEALAAKLAGPRPSTPHAVNRLRMTARTLRARYRGRGDPPGWRTAKTTLAAVLAYLLAVWLLGDQVPPLLAPLTALLVAQLTIFETVKSGIERVGSVVAGVLVAVGLSHFVGLTWWSLGIVIFAALTIGTILRLGDHTLEVPISAMLVLAVAGQTGTAALSRVVETLIGAVTGVVVSFVLRPPVYVQPAGDAIGALAAEMAELLSSMGEELTEGWSSEQARNWEDRARELDRPLRAARVALARGEESLRLNPRQRRVREGASSLRAALAALEHAAVQVRALTLDLADLAEAVEATDQAEPELLIALGRLLVELGAGVAAFGQLVAPEVAGPPREVVPLHIALEIARTHRDVLAELMLVDARAGPGAVAHPGQPAGQRRPAAARDRPGAGAGRPARPSSLTCDTTGGGSHLGRPGRSGWMDVHLITDAGVSQCGVEDLPDLLERREGLVWVDIPRVDRRGRPGAGRGVRVPPAGHPGLREPQPRPQGARLPRPCVHRPALARAGQGRPRPPPGARPVRRPRLPGHRARARTACPASPPRTRAPCR